MRLSHWFIAVAVVCAGALGWLGWLLLEQDNAVEAQHRRESLDQLSDRAVAIMQRLIVDLESQLEGNGSATPDVVFLIADGSGISGRAERGLLYYPVAAIAADASPEVFADAERLEFGQKDLAAAAQAYDRIAASADPVVRAGALTRAARCYRKLRNPERALAAYDRLERIPRATVAGLPAGLVAREGRAGLFEEMKRTAELEREATALRSELGAGRWQLVKPQFEYHAGQAAAWLGKAAPIDTDAIARAEAFDWLWRNRASVEPAARRLMRTSLILWKTSGDRLYVAVAGEAYLNRIRAEAIPAGFAWTLSDLEGHTVMGEVSPARDAAIRTAATTRLPWSLQLSAPAAAAGPSSGRQLLLWVFAVLAIVLSAGAYFILRAISQEQRVARLQSDFVAAVSHEFRSPLSSMAQISEMLVRDRFPNEDLRRKSYDILSRETARLRGLVEGLLDFGRFEAGASLYRFETLEAGAFLRGVIADFQERVAPDGYSIELSLPDVELHVSADREALTRAIWNLLDNAVKYSPESHTVWVDVERQENRIAIAVRDRGLGIPVKEQREIFERFVRGAESKARRIKGTGIGLAMVRRIVQAHGGEILLTSEPGQGSRFTMVLRVAS